MVALSANAARFQTARTPGAVESWFLRANHPTERRAIWLKATVLRPLTGPAIAEAWCVVFGPGSARGAKDTVPLDSADFSMPITIANTVFDLQEGQLHGQVKDLAWKLALTRHADPVGAPLSLYSDRLLHGPFPKNKVLTPAPALTFRGSITIGDERIEVDDWLGMQGHNWQPAHSPAYAWAQCSFSDEDNSPHTIVEAAAGKVKVGAITTPTLGAMVIRRGDQEYRFGPLMKRLRLRSTRQDLVWTARFRGRDGTASVRFEARPEEVACLGYANPDGRLAYCLNSKLASASLRVNPSDGPAFACESAHGAALEFLQPTFDPRFGDVI